MALMLTHEGSMETLNWLMVVGFAGIGGLAFLRILSNGRSGVLLAHEQRLEESRRAEAEAKEKIPA